MYTIRKMYKVEYAHQLKSAYSKACSDTIHGHSGIVEIFIDSDMLNDDDMVIDFGKISKLIKSHIMDLLDHALVVPITLNKEYIKWLNKYNKKLRVVERNPTAEFFSNWLYSDITNVLRPVFSKAKQHIRLTTVRFHETDTGYAEFTINK